MLDAQTIATVKATIPLLVETGPKLTAHFYDRMFTHNPELREKLFTFDVDILSNDLCDLSLNLQLTERVIVSTDGTVSSVEAVPEPDVPDEMWTVKRG